VGGVSLSLAEYAEAKRLAVDFLLELGLRDEDWHGTVAVAIPYRDQDGAELAVRYRLELNGAHPFRWPQGTKAKGLVYGLERWRLAAAAGYAHVVEGESDAQTAWLHGVPCFGIPGALMFDDERTSPCLEGIGGLYVVQEPGEAGEQLVEALRGSRLADRVHAVSFGADVKDVSALHLAVNGDHDLFLESLERARNRSIVERSSRSIHVLSDTAGKPARSLTASGIEDIHASFDRLMLLPDHGAVSIALAAIVANYATGDPVWPLLVGPPGCGKSELVNALGDVPDVWALSSLTPQTLISGFEATRGGKPASLLLQIGEFGIVTFKDLTTVLTMNREARGEIIGQLREVADGQTAKSFGTGLRVQWQGKLGLVAGVTPVIDEQHAFLALMGERFVLYRMPEVTRHELARYSLVRRGDEPELRSSIRQTVAAFLSGFRDCGRLELPGEFMEPLVGLTDLVTRARTGVSRDRWSRDMLYMPQAEAPTRLAKQLAQLAAALLAIGVDEAETWRLIRKVGWDCVPAVRCAVLDCLGDQVEPVPMATVVEMTELPPRTVARTIEDLVALRLVSRRKDVGKWLVEASSIAHDYWISERLPATSEGG
jgi:hypothetical protein